MALDPHGRGALGSPVGGLRHARRTGRGRGGRSSSSERKPFIQQLQDFPRLADRLDGASPPGSVRGAGPLRECTSGRISGRILLVGDAAGYVDALTGEGISVSLACARSLVDAVQRDQPAAYERAWLRDTRRYRWITLTLLRARRLAVDAIVSDRRCVPDVFRAAVGQLAR